MTDDLYIALDRAHVAAHETATVFEQAREGDPLDVRWRLTAARVLLTEALAALDEADPLAPSRVA